MNPSSHRHYRAQGLPVAYVLVAVVAALLVGMFIGKSGSRTQPEPRVASGDALSSGDLKECKSENRELIAALDRAGGDTSRYRRTDRNDDKRSGSTRSGSRASGTQSSFGSRPASTKSEPERQTASVRAWSGRAQKLANSPDVLASGSVLNRESVSVEGMLYVVLTTLQGSVVAETSLPMSLPPKQTTKWEHVFRWVPDEPNVRYSITVAWETMSF